MTAALAFAALLFPAEPPAPVYLPDLAAFRGATVETARANARLANTHTEKTIEPLPGDWCKWAMRQRQQEAWFAWSHLADALDETRPTYKRAAALKCLRIKLGDDAYFAGSMPGPTPGYLYPPFPPAK